MRKLFFYSLFLLSFSLIMACNKKDDDNKYEFKDQIASGEIGGNAWVYKSGRAKSFSTEVIFSLYKVELENPCAIPPTGEDIVTFSLPKKTGIYELALGKKTATLFSSSDQLNNICTKGAIEILKIEGDSLIKGQIDMSFETKGFYINGRFEAVICKSTVLR